MDMSFHNTISDVSGRRQKCKRKFLHYFPGGFHSPKFNDWERGYKWNAHLQWQDELNQQIFDELLRKKKYREIASRVVRIESRTNLLFSFEKMALRDAVSSPAGSKLFALGLYDFIYEDDRKEGKFNQYLNMIGSLPRKQTRVLTWPVVTVFGFIANPAEHIFLKPIVTKQAALKYRFEFDYQSSPNWNTYMSLMNFAAILQKDISALKPRDLIDIQSFIWVLGSEEYPDR
jgi:hypothetical protein